jgi:large subunit ribosomal protein L4
VALGPKPRSYAQKTPKKMIQLALRSALSDRAAQGRVAVIDAWTFDVPSTKAALASLEALGLSGRVLVVLGEGDGYADRSFGNLPEIQTILVGELNAYDILVNDWIVFTDETLPGSSTPGAAPEVADEVAEEATDEPITDEAITDEAITDEAITDEASAGATDEAGADGSES